jgi:hypothetical protein
MKKIIAVLVFVSATTILVAQKNNQNQKNEIKVPMKAESWDSKEGKLKFADHNGVPSVEISGGESAIIKNLDFTNGIIEYDLEFGGGFASCYFRRQSDDESELFYLRGVANPNTSIDAVQYTPIIKKVNMWDMYPDYQAAATFKTGEWTHIKLVVSGMQMLAYVNDPAYPRLQVFRLEGNTKNGSIAFQGNCFVSNVVVKPNEVEGLSPIEGFDPVYNDIRYIQNWQISQPMPLPPGQELSNSNMPDIQTTWQPIRVERKGLVNITRLYGQSTDRRFVWLRKKIITKTARKLKVDFGFSDEAWVFVNDRATFVDKNLYGQNMRKKPDGRISTQNSSFEIPLNEGENVLVIGVANNFYGWGIILHFDDLDGITLSSDFAPEVLNKDFEPLFGSYSSKQLPLKFKVSQRNNKLSLLPSAEGPIEFDQTGKNTFSKEQYKITLEFIPTENKLVFTQGGKAYDFLRE